MEWKRWICLAAACGTLAASADAFACDYAVVDYQVAGVASPDRIAIASTLGLRGENVTLTDASGAAIPGEVEALDEFPNIYLFLPDERLEPGAHTLRITDEFDSEVEEFVEVGPLGAPDVSFEVELSEAEVAAEMVCCDTVKGGCKDSCQVCTSCWPSAYRYVPQAEVTLRTNQPLLASVSLSDEATGEEMRLGGYRVFTAETAVTTVRRLQQEGAGELCVQVDVIDLDGDAVYAETRCFDADEMEALPRRQPDEPEAVRACASPPENTSDPNWQRYGRPPVVRGCNTGSGAPSTLAPTLLLLLALMLGRRRGWE